MSVYWHAQQEGWTDSASLAWIQIGSLLLMSHCRDIWERRRGSNEALSITVKWGCRERRKVKEEMQENVKNEARQGEGKHFCFMNDTVPSWEWEIVMGNCPHPKARLSATVLQMTHYVQFHLCLESTDKGKEKLWLDTITTTSFSLHLHCINIYFEAGKCSWSV